MLRWIVAAALALAVTLPTQWAAAVVNLNTATKDELIALPGIGPAKAQAILDYRSTNGAFKSVEELKDVKGIGARRFEKLKAELTVTAPPKAVAAAGKPESKADAAKPGASAAKGEIRPVADAKSKK
ncbi:MAG: helix-hairpin-helix domain-containing protein [Casimicrobiaceae bacterium]